jgi:hypothetical protein
MAELFSVAKCFVVPTNSSQPVEIGVLQQVKIDISIKTVELRGQYRYPVLVAQGEGAIKGSANMARFNSQTINALLNSTLTANSSYLLGNSTDENSGTPITIPATPGPYTVTVTNHTTFTQDGGVILCGASELFNVQMTRVGTSATPTTGQYKVSTGGVYTFAAADQGKTIIIDYEYTSASGNLLTLNNVVMGATYPFELWAETELQGEAVVFKFPNVLSNKFTIDLKRGAWNIPAFDFDVFPNGAGQVLIISTSY